MDGIHNYSCKCSAGYTGGNCETGKFVLAVLVAVALFSLLNIYYFDYILFLF